MALVTITALEKSYGSLDILRGASFAVHEGSRTALVGPNGCGKTTLVRILVGLERADTGTLATLPGTDIGYLPQEVAHLEGLDVLSAVLVGSPRLAELEADLADLEARMATTTGDALDTLSHRYGDAQAEFSLLGGYDAEARAKTLLAGLGFVGEDLHKSVDVLSGGQRTRVYLARLLYQEPTLLVLDEPTNHLDLDAVEWLEEYLRVWKGTILIVSHDRAFLDQIADHVVDLSGGIAVSYRGDYTEYARQKEFNDAQRLQAYERQKEEVTRLQAYVDRYRAGNRATMAKSRQKSIDRLERVDRPDRDPDVKFRLKPSHASGREALVLEGVSKSYGPLTLFRPFELWVNRGDRIGIVGPNGAGKSTFLRCLMGIETFDGGDMTLGHNVAVGTLSQQAEELDEGNTVLDELMANSTLQLAEARDLLAQFLFRGDDVFKAVGALSGGERNRLLISRLLAARPNCLMLDEPTNHLDLWCRRALENALAHYPGTVLFASHDRYLLQRVATRILEIKGGAAKVWEETWEEYRARTRPALPTSLPKPGSKAAKAAAEALKRKHRGARGPSPEKELKRIEGQIAPLEARIRELTDLLADAATYLEGGAAKALTDEYEAATVRLQDLYEEWEPLAEEVTALTA